MEHNTIICRDVKIQYLDDAGNVLMAVEHRVWNVERFYARLNAECKKNREKGEGHTQWQLLS